MFRVYPTIFGCHQHYVQMLSHTGLTYPLLSDKNPLFKTKLRTSVIYYMLYIARIKNYIPQIHSLYELIDVEREYVGRAWIFYMTLTSLIGSLLIYMETTWKQER